MTQESGAASVTAVIPNFNGARFLPRVIEDLRKQSHPVACIMVVDNGSTDSSIAVSTEAGADVIRLESNQGFAAAVNRGMRDCATPFLAVLNNDVELDPHWLERLMGALELPDTWFATGKIASRRHTGRIDATFDCLARSGLAWRCGHGRPDSPLWDQHARIWSAPWTAAVFRRELFDRIGQLDERFESYLEDTEFGLRCALAEKPGAYVPAALAWHWGSATLGMWHPETVRRLARNQVFLVAKHFPALSRSGLWWPVLAGQLLWGAVALRHGRLHSYLKGKWEGLRRFSELRPLPAPVTTGPFTGADERIVSVLARSERTIRDLQQRSGWDLYWRLYFTLT